MISRTVENGRACVCSGYNAHSDWIILGHYRPITDLQKQSKRRTYLSQTFSVYRKSQTSALSLSLGQYGKISV